MQHTESIALVATALAAAQGEFPLIPRDRTVTVRPRARKGQDGQQYQPPAYQFNYAPLPTVLEKVRPALAKNGLCLTQSVVTINDKGHEAVRTMLIHCSGEWLANETPLFAATGDNASQAYSSGLTYARRYGVTALLCIAADDDDDAEGAGEGEQRQPVTAGRKPQGNGNTRPAVATPQEKPASQPSVQQGAGTPLSQGPQRVLEAKAKSVGMTLEQVAAEFGEVTMANLNEVLGKLSERQQ